MSAKYTGKNIASITDLVTQVKNIDINNLQQRIFAGNGKDEISLLAGTFNDMLDRLEEAFKTQKDFIANASHELRTPLTAITGNLEVTLLKERTSEEYRQALVSTLEEVRNLNQLTNRLLALLRTGTAITDTTFMETRVDDVLWKARSDYLKTHPNHLVEISFDESIQEENSFILKGNPELLKIAFLNLIENGCKYTVQNKIMIRFSLHENSLFINFKDNGIGIPRDEITQVLQPFYRAKNVKNKKGHGIGLSLADRIISLHDGEIRINSILGKGTSIKILLPLG